MHTPSSHSGSMTARERFRASLGFGRPDRLTLSPTRPRQSTLAVWQSQGLPDGVEWYSRLLDALTHIRVARDFVIRKWHRFPV